MPAQGFAAHPVEEGVAFGGHAARTGEAVDRGLRGGDVDGVVFGPGAFEHDLIVREGYDNVSAISDLAQARRRRDPFRVVGVDDCDLRRGDRDERRRSERSGSTGQMLSSDRDRRSITSSTISSPTV